MVSIQGFLDTFLWSKNWWQIQDGRHFTKKSAFWEQSTTRVVLYFSGSYKMVGHFISGFYFLAKKNSGTIAGTLIRLSLLNLYSRLLRGLIPVPWYQRSVHSTPLPNPINTFYLPPGSSMNRFVTLSQEEDYHIPNGRQILDGCHFYQQLTF
jgi:hypothetical protein